MKILGLTGDIACGKSSVARLLVDEGAHHVDADLLVRELYAKPAFAAELAQHFGDILDDNGGVSREKLGALVFHDADELHQLEALVHPAVASLRAQKLEELERSGAQSIVLEAVKLLESGQGRGCDAIWCVVASPEAQTRRMVENRGLSVKEAQKRLASQPSREAKLLLAGATPIFWLENDGSLSDLAAKVQTLWRRFQES